MTQIKVTTKSTSANTMIVNPIVLRETTLTRLVFIPLIIHENPKNKEADLKGCFAFQKKNKKDEWDNISIDGETLSNLKTGEGYKLQLSSAELFKLFEELESIKEIHEKYGFNYDRNTFTITKGNIEGVFLQLANIKNKDWVIENLKLLEKENFESLQFILGSAKIDKIIEEWENNKANNNEIYWQELFQNNAWVLQQVFSYPVIMLQGETYVGGKNTKGRSGQGGVATDFLLQDQSTNSFALIEIKTPCTALVGSIYRGARGTHADNETYSMSTDLSGGLVQLQNQLITAVENFHNSLGRDFQNENLNYLIPHGVLIIGSLDNLESQEKESFFMFRKSLKDITVITYDELFEKIKYLKKIFNEEDPE